MGNGNDEIRQLSATLDPVPANGSTLRANVSGGVISQPDDKIPKSPDHEQHVKDFGWNEDKPSIGLPLVEGIDNKNLWILMRRFNKQIFHLKETSNRAAGGLDFNVAEDEEFSPHKLRAYIERLYRGALLGLLGFVQHIARLRSWREPRRTSSFFIIYFTSWYFDFLMPTLLTAVLLLVTSPSARNIMFPPAPPALVDHKTGGLSKPRAGILASTDSITGAAEHAKGEAIENESSNFVTGIAAIATNTLIEKDRQCDEESEGENEPFPSTNELVTKVAVAKDKASGVDKASQDMTKSPMEQLMWSKMRPLMHGICILSDSWERSANLLSPMPPFSHTAKYRVACIILPILVLSTLVTCHTVYRIATFGLGVGFFSSNGSAVRAYNWLKSRNLTLAGTLFRHVPTDAQLTITLLRLGESQRAPLVPPQISRKPPTQRPHPVDDEVLDATGGDKPLGATEEEVQNAVQKDLEGVRQHGADDDQIGESSGKRHSRFLSLFKGSIKTATKGLIGVDKMRAKAGTESAKKREGATSKPAEPPISGPIEFKARYNGGKGFIYLTTDTNSPCICFSKKPYIQSPVDLILQEVHPAWVIPIKDITQLKKYSGYGAKAKLAAGWALDSKVMDGIEIIDKRGCPTVITAVPRRDELFNRLCAMGSHRWEVW